MLLLSNSMINSWLDIQEGDGCGLLFEAIYVKREIKDERTTDAQEAGQFFEYKATGALAYGGKVPLAKYRANTSTLLPEFEIALRQAARFKDFLKTIKAKIVAVGREVIDEAKGSILHLDLEVDLPGSLHRRIWGPTANLSKPVIIDLKFTAGIDASYGEFAWAAEGLPKKKGLTRQAIHYQWTTEQDFAWYLADPSIRMLRRFYPVNISEETLENHGRFVGEVREEILEAIQDGFIPNPSEDRCEECPLFSTCPSRAEMPVPQVIEL